MSPHHATIPTHRPAWPAPRDPASLERLGLRPPEPERPAAHDFLVVNPRPDLLGPRPPVAGRRYTVDLP